MNKKTTPLISVIMPVFNGQKYLHEAIESVLNQTYHHFEFFIISDGSTDKTNDIIKSYALKDKRINLIILPKNNGISNAINIGINHSHGPYIARTDCDDICLSDRFAKQIDYLLHHPKIDVLGTHLYEFLNNNKDIYTTDYQVGLHLISQAKQPVAHPTVMMKRNIFTRFGLYDSRFDNAEDHELWYRFYSHGVKFANLNDFLYKKRIHNSNISILRRKAQVSTTLKINLLALFRYNIHFNFIGYTRILEQIIYLTYLTIKNLFQKK